MRIVRVCRKPADEREAPLGLLVGRVPEHDSRPESSEMLLCGGEERRAEPAPAPFERDGDRERAGPRGALVFD